MDFLQSLLDNSSIPAITAFILGILTAVSPCPLATNITAIGFISKDIENHHRIFINGLLYTFGRIVTYTALGFILIPILREGASMFMVQKAVSKYGEMLIAPVLIIIGIFMLDIIKLNIPKVNIGGLRYCKAMGVELKDRGITQVSMNLTDYSKTAIYRDRKSTRLNSSHTDSSRMPSSA